MPWQDVFVCRSVGLSVTRRHSIEMAKHIVKLFQQKVGTPF